MGISQFINPYILYSLLVVGAAGVCLAMPRRGTTPQIVGALLAAAAFGLVLLFMGLKAGLENLPNIYFYIFSLIGLGGALRVITHPKPVYAALYFIMTVVASAGLFLILSAEFALVIVYAGAILITYLFVIMLATQAPEEGQDEVLADYDISAREPIAAAVVGFLLIAVLTTYMFRGAGQLAPASPINPNALLADMPRKVERALQTEGVIAAGDKFESFDAATNTIVIKTVGGETTNVPYEAWKGVEELAVTNPEHLGFNLLREHPGTIEIAGVILLMAMLGAVVLSRKQVQMDEDAKAARVTQLARLDPSHEPGVESPLELSKPSGGQA
jgi:NADH-quinone oxidoreductase subunit J